MDRGCKISACRPDIHSIITNCLHNSIKFSHVKGLVTIRAFKKEPDLIIQIIDEGVGMSKEQLAKIADEYPEKSQYGTLGEKGTGLGVVICFHLVKKNNGSIKYTSEVGKGTTVTIAFPLYNDHGEVNPA